MASIRYSRLITFSLCVSLFFSHAVAWSPLAGRAVLDRTHHFLKKDRNLFLVSFAAALAFNYAHYKLKDRVADWLPAIEPEPVKPAPIFKPQPVVKPVAPIEPPVAIPAPSHDYLDGIAITPREAIALPHQIARLNHYEVHQVFSPRQEGPSCGWYTIMNAKAIQEIITSKEPLSAHAIKQRVHNEFIPIVKSQEGSLKKMLGVAKIFSALTSDQIALLARHLKVHNYYAIDILEGNHRGGMVVGSDKNLIPKGKRFMPLHMPNGNKYFVHQPQELLHLIKHDTAPIIHLMLAAPCPEDKSGSINYDTYHAVLITIINRPHQKPLLLYFDSNNDPLGATPYRAAPAHARYVCDFIAQLDQA